jgi:hypothetical protein
LEFIEQWHRMSAGRVEFPVKMIYDGRVLICRHQALLVSRGPAVDPPSTLLPRETTPIDAQALATAPIVPFLLRRLKAAHMPADSAVVRSFLEEVRLRG